MQEIDVIRATRRYLQQRGLLGAKEVMEMAAVQQITLRLRADFVGWLEEEAKRRNQELEVQGSEFKYTAADIAGPILEEAIAHIRAKDLKLPED